MLKLKSFGPFLDYISGGNQTAAGLFVDLMDGIYNIPKSEIKDNGECELTVKHWVAELPVFLSARGITTPAPIQKMDGVTCFVKAGKFSKTPLYGETVTLKVENNTINNAINNMAGRDDQIN